MGSCSSCFASNNAVQEERPKPATQHAKGTDSFNTTRTTRPSVDPAERYGVKSQFQVVKLAGKGAAGDVWVCRNLSSKELVAIKFMKRPLSKSIQALVKRELKIHALVGEGHVNVVRAYDAMLTNSHLGLTMEYAAGGNLTSYVARKYEHSKVAGLFLSEDEARFFFRQFIDAVSYCHSKQVAHRDLKLDNVLLTNEDPPVLKLTDFGFAKSWVGVGRNTAHIGTPVYMSPETIKQDKNMTYAPPTVDVWASGILLVVMLMGAFPFDHTKHPDPNSFEAQYEVWQQEVTEKWYESPFLKDKPQKLSPLCKDLLNRIFEVDPIKRITISEIMQHQWYNEPLPEKYQRVLESLHQQQMQVQEHIATLSIDQVLVDEREAAIDAMVDKAGKRVQDSSMGNVNALQIVDYKRDDIMHINLTNAAIQSGAPGVQGFDSTNGVALTTTTTDGEAVVAGPGAGAGAGTQGAVKVQTSQRSLERLGTFKTPEAVAGLAH